MTESVHLNSACSRDPKKVRKSNFKYTDEESALMLSLRKCGLSWKAIAERFPSRSADGLRIYYRTIKKIERVGRHNREVALQQLRCRFESMAAQSKNTTMQLEQLHDEAARQDALVSNLFFISKMLIAKQAAEPEDIINIY
jgi:PP-loop superfamily ATP-utilizing enzyme